MTCVRSFSFFLFFFQKLSSAHLKGTPSMYVWLLLITPPIWLSLKARFSFWLCTPAHARWLMVSDGGCPPVGSKFVVAFSSASLSTQQDQYLGSVTTQVYGPTPRSGHAPLWHASMTTIIGTYLCQLQKAQVNSHSGTAMGKRQVN